MIIKSRAIDSVDGWTYLADGSVLIDAPESLYFGCSIEAECIETAWTATHNVYAVKRVISVSYPIGGVDEGRRS
jgi:hypothetical protein